ncbi:acyltransferase family protein [Nocardiopsis trehalosi]|uniref:acyltransferase family protein n=1 Tax=Nocardiopsis trehalosi TaxID=109329 RepID=UPI0008337321|nr:acyltransferase [Nocardiopsis trehalosi]
MSTHAGPAASAASAPPRRHDVDRLRNAAILFLFPYHTARMFDTGAPFYVKGDTAPAATVLVESSFWFMPLLFLLAGMSSRYALRRRTARAFAAERVRRLLVPLLFGFLVVVPPQAYYARRFRGEDPGGYAEFLVSYFTDFSDWSEYGGGISPAHLWFIGFLLVISLALLPAMRAVRDRGYAPAWLRHPVLVLLPVPAVALLALVPDIAGKNILVYAAYVLLGYLLAGDDRALEAIARHRRTHLALGVLGTAGMLAAALSGADVPTPAATAWEAFACWTVLLAMLGYGRRHLSRPGRATAHATALAYPVYIVHQTVVVAAGFYVLPVVDRAPTAFALVMGSGLVVSIAVCAAARRFAPTRFLLGMK